MTDSRWARTERLYHAAVELPPRDRAAFVRTEAAGDLELAAEVEALLAYDDRPAAFMQRSAIELAARVLAEGQPLGEPERSVGPDGAYEIVRPIGSGGMGDVYLAHDGRLARHVALKVLRSGPPDLDWIAAFRQEALAASSLNHPNILTIYEIGEHEGTSFIAAEYVNGVTLRERLKKGPLPLHEQVAVALQIAEGLAAAHEAGVVHRDIKPDNVMLRADGLVKILDFGIATRTASSDVSPVPPEPAEGDGVVIGTTGYMSPEQSRGHPVDATTDVWSLGVVIYEMATGQVPAWLSHTEPTTSRRDSGRLSPGELAHLPPELLPIVTRALSTDRAARHASARALAGELRALSRALDRRLEHRAATPWHSGRRVAGMRLRWQFGAAAAILITATVCLVALTGRAREPRQITSIGMMPLENAENARDGEYLAEGIAASLRSRLAQFGSIRQAAASEAIRYDRLGVSAAEAGREMKVDAVLTGTLDRRADSLLVRLQLLRSSDAATLWKRQFLRPAADVVTLQTEIARELVDALGVSRQAGADSEERRDPSAYQLYAKGRYHVLKRTPEDLRKGLAYLHEAVALDSQYGRAYAKLADGYILLAMTSDVAPRQAFPQARAAAERALAIDPGLSEARVSMGLIKFWFDWDWSGAEAEFRRAIGADQPDPAAHMFYGHLLSNLGDHTGALQEMRRALDYEPHSALANALFAQCLYYQGSYDESLAHLGNTLALAPSFWLTHNMMGRIYGLKGMTREALQSFNRASELGASLVVRAAAGYTLAASGRRDEARAVLEELKMRAAQAYVPPSNLALVHLGLGEYDAALDRLEEAVEARDMLVTFLTVEPRWAALAAQPRFSRLLGAVGLRQ
jgi:TolB-like protein/Flp pilus assembly protein TadD